MDRTEKTTDAEFKEWKGHYETLYKQTEKLKEDFDKVYKFTKGRAFHRWDTYYIDF